nr:C25 family cysteine peptidase [bacterium]
DPLGMGTLPSDNYYADLYNADGTYIHWDYDDDDRIGEFPDDLDDMDFAPDVCVMRIPASTVPELTTAITHIIGYESIPSHTEDWLNTVVFAAVDTFNAEAHGEMSGIPEGEQYAEMLASDLFVDDQIVRLYETDTYPKDDVCYPETVSQTVSGGAGYLAFHCHGAPDCFQLADYACFDHTHCSQMTNADMLPLIYGFACSTAAFDNEIPGYPYSTGAESMPEHFLLNPQGGGIAFIGSTRVAFASGFGHDQHMTGSGAIEYWFWNARKNGILTSGQMFAQAQIDYLRHVGVLSVYDYITIMEHNGFGDPSVTFGGWFTEPRLNVYGTAIENISSGGSCILPGDDVNLTLRVINEGIPVGTPVFELVSDHPDVSIVQGTASIETLPRISSAEVGPFRMEIEASCPDSILVPLELVVSDGASE